MAAVDILAAFSYKWAQAGTVALLDDAQYKAGWAFIGATPPSVEQFNKVHQIADEKANYLYAQMLSVFTLAGQTPTPGNGNSLRDSLAALYGDGRYIGTRVITATGVFTATAGVKSVRVRLWSGGGGGGGAASTAAGQVSLGSGGSTGSYSESYLKTGFNGVTITIGGGGSGVFQNNGNAGGASSFGALMTCPGGPGGQRSIAGATTSIGVLGGSVATGGNILNLAPLAASPLIATASLGAILGGTGADSAVGGGGRANITATGGGSAGANGTAAGGFASGGSGATSAVGFGGASGGSGSGGLCLADEFI